MKNLFKSLAAFQQECPVILKDTTGYGYKYADLPEILKVVNPLLKKHGLGFYQAVDVTDLKTVIFHIESGETIESQALIPQNVQLKGMNDFQVLGSAITYMKRYQLSAMLGIVTDKDTDASGEQLPKGKPYWYADAVKALSNGTVTLDQIEKKYKLTEELRESLMNDAL
jgi:hypothetical protein